MELFPCVHRGPVLRTEKCKPCKRGNTDVMQCTKLGECTLRTSEVRNKSGRLPSCMACEHRVDHGASGALAGAMLSLSAPHEPAVTEDAVSQPLVGSAAGRPAGFLENTQSGGVFLMCGGPSLKEVDFDLFNQRGIVTAAVNNAATLFRPNIWVSVDKPGHFHEHIWGDSGIMKFTRWCVRDGVVRTRAANRLTTAGRMARECPNTWFFEHQSTMDYKKFLSMNPMTWGTNNKTETAVDSKGRKQPGKRSCMLPAIRLLYWLGFRRIYLAGCDFNMTPEATYAFDDPKRPSACQSNNGTYQRLNEWFGFLLPHFKENGLEIFNCTDGGNLNAFPRKTLEAAVAREAITGELEVRGMYSGFKNT